MAKYELRLQARELRRKGYSTTELYKKFGVSKSTMSSWCSDIILTPEQRIKLIKRSREAGIKGSETNHRRRMERIEFFKASGKKNLSSLTKKERLVAGISLYWAEGTKKRGKLSLTNSDPTMIKFFADRLVDTFGVCKEDLHPRVMINAIHEPRIDTVTKYWADLLQINLDQFANPILLRDRPKKVYENHDNYFGVLSLEVRRGTDKKYEILGLIDVLKQL